RQDKHRLVLQLGYPIYLRKARSGSTFFVDPLMLIPFDTPSFLYGGTPFLIDEVPRFNFTALENVSGLKKNVLLEEIMIISDELGLNNPLEDQPDFDEIAIRLQQIRPQWRWVETIMPDNLTTMKLNDAKTQGIYNAAAIFFSERSKFTQGLEKELTDFKQLSVERYKSSALGHLIPREFPAPEQKNIPLIEPLPLNDEQREAVRKALQSSLTVVTGPPGTGKSQVVTSIIINAVYQGQTVLFASKNNKAVDVVGERVNGLTSKPVMLRLGSNELQAELAQYLSGLLSSSSSKANKDQYETLKQKHNELVKRMEEIRHSQDNFLRIRNITDKLEQDVEKLRELFGEELFAQIRNWDEKVFQNIEALIKGFSKALESSDKNKQPLFVRLLWFIFKSFRCKKASSSYENLRKY
ncbi:MAG: AAA family ATPase, partial [Planctomycetes bacterium]|nr:AAA family ATPase [Planctomycetota bacterium]